MKALRSSDELKTTQSQQMMTVMGDSCKSLDLLACIGMPRGPSGVPSNIGVETFRHATWGCLFNHHQVQILILMGRVLAVRILRFKRDTRKGFWIY